MYLFMEKNLKLTFLPREIKKPKTKPKQEKYLLCRWNKSVLVFNILRVFKITFQHYHQSTLMSFAVQDLNNMIKDMLNSFIAMFFNLTYNHVQHSKKALQEENLNSFMLVNEYVS